MSRRVLRRLAGVLSIVAAAASLTACGGAAEPVSGPTVDTMFGPVTVPADPQRVVALGWSDAETALALGVQPVGASDWLAFGGEGVGPWSAGRYTAAPVQLGTNQVDYEKLLALKPDLILNTRSDGDRAKYDALSRIAPTVSPPAGVVSYGTSWQQQMTSVAAALGKPDAGRAAIAEVDSAFAAAAKAHPQFAGKTVAVGAAFDGKYGAYVRGDARVAFLEALGFTNKPEVDALSTDNSFYVELSTEKLSLLSADLTVALPLNGPATEIKNNPTLNAIDSARAGHLVVLDDPTLVQAFSAGSTQATRYALEKAVPLFARALPGA